MGEVAGALPGLQLSQACRVLRAGFNGKYAYAPVRSASGVTFYAAPNKSAHSHIHDALHYAVLGVGGAELVLGKEARTAARQPRMATGINYDLTGDRDDTRGSERADAVHRRAMTFHCKRSAIPY